MKIPLLKGREAWILAIGALGGYAIATWMSHRFGFADKPKQPSDSDINKMIKQHHIGDPSKDIYDVQGPYASGKHKGDIEITDLGPYSTPKKSHPKHTQASIYPSYSGSGPSNSDCCAMLQQMMSQQQGGGGPPMMGGMYAYDEGWGYDDW